MGKHINTGTKRTRNSSIELLRIISMYMIVSHHFVVLSQIKTLEEPFSVNKLFADLVLRPGGKIGVAIFFLISAYFICQEVPDIKRNAKRIIALDAEMLFWSLSITFTFIIFNNNFVSGGILISSFLPLLSKLWWYPTSYAIFLVLSPFITISLRRIGKDMHFKLSLLLIVLWGLVAGLLPKIYLDISPQNMIIFCYMYVFVSYYVWYLKPISRKLSLGFIIIGVILIWSNILLCSFLYQITGLRVFVSLEDTFISHEWKLPVMLVSLGLFSLFASFRYYCNSINIIAKCTFGVFLIHNHPIMSQFLSKTIFDMKEKYFSPYYPIIATIIIGLVFLLCTIADMVRQGIFIITINRFIDAVLNRIWNLMILLKVYVESLLRSYEIK